MLAGPAAPLLVQMLSLVTSDLADGQFCFVFFVLLLHQPETDIVMVNYDGPSGWRIRGPVAATLCFATLPPLVHDHRQALAPTQGLVCGG